MLEISTIVLHLLTPAESHHFMQTYIPWPTYSQRETRWKPLTACTAAALLTPHTRTGEYCSPLPHTVSYHTFIYMHALIREPTHKIVYKR